MGVDIDLEKFFDTVMLEYVLVRTRDFDKSHIEKGGGIVLIPKIIHYCWFGGNILPEDAKRCIESWKKYCPDYEIKQWNETNYNIHACKYVEEAYKAKKWAFVSDYARMDILYQYGGIYLDTDVELIKCLDSILEKGPFMGLEKDFETNGSCMVATGLGIGIYKGHLIYKEVLDYYKNINFINEDGSLNLVTVVEHVTSILKKHGLIDKPGIQNIGGINIYPKEYFCPKDVDTHELKITQNTISIHHYDSSWGQWYDRAVVKRGEKLIKIFGVNLGNKINSYIYFIQKFGIRGILRKIRGNR